jgi:hypothetical protein
MRSKGAIRDEKGAALVLVLILLLIGGLITAGLLSHMGAGLLAGEIYERRTDELYAADAGVEDAIWKIQNQDGYLPCNPGSDPSNYTVADVNGKSMEISIAYVDGGTYKITSIAATDDDSGTAAIESATTIEAYLSVSYLDLAALLDNAIISQDTITIQPNNTINGDIWLPDEEDLYVGNHVSINGTVKDNDNMTITWPTAEQLSSYYMEGMEGAYDPGSFVEIADLNSTTIGPWYREGNLAVDNTGGPTTLVLEGTIYVAGDLEFWQPSDGNEYTINLNGNTIFAEGSISFASNHITISGSGCIIAVGDINFQPGIAGGEDDFVLVLSITGQTYFHPSGDFTGCVAGNTHVQLQPGCTINWISPEGKGLDVPMGVGDDGQLPPVTGVSIESWEVIQQ